MNLQQDVFGPTEAQRTTESIAAMTAIIAEMKKELKQTKSDVDALKIKVSRIQVNSGCNCRRG